MLNFDFGKTIRTAPILVEQEITLRGPELGDYRAWFDLRSASRAHLTRWEPDWSEEEATLDAFKARLKNQERLLRSGSGLAFHIVERTSGALIGGVSLTDIRYHASQSATIGYWIGAGHLRRGYGLCAVRALLTHAFGVLALNRIEAACQPGNLSSRGLLAKAGFREEGFARDYLFINGEWRDHLLFAATARDALGVPAATSRLQKQG